jgi:multiple sugar transport system permease protein
MLHWYVNSAVTSAIITVLTVAFGSMAAYAFSQLRFPGRTVLFWVLMAGLTVPLDVLIIPLFTQLSSWHMINTYWAIILPQVATPVAVFIMKQFFDGIPPALSRAARADGASHWRIFRSIYLPLARPAVGAVAIFTFVSAWNNFLWPFTAITSTNMMTIPVGIATVTNAYGIHYADLMASALLGGLPLLVLFVVFQRRVVQGIANTGLRG